jgi:site-specific recombinase
MSLLTLLAGLREAPPRLDHGWLIELVDALRPARGQSPAAAAERVDRLCDRLETAPEDAAALATHLFALFAGRRQRHLLAETGVALESGFLSELTGRIARRWLPAVPDPGLWMDILGEVFPRADDARWVEAVGQARWTRLIAILAQAAADLPGTGAGRQRLRHETLEALRLLAHRLAALGTHAEMLRYHGSADTPDAVFLDQASALLAWCAQAEASEHPLAIVAPEAAERLDRALDSCDAALDAVRERARRQGASVALTLRLRHCRQSVARIRRLMAIARAEPPAACAQAAGLLIDLVRGEASRDSVRALLAGSSDLVALQITENTSRTGEHYVTADRREWLAMARSAMGAGVIVGFMAMVKILLAGLHLPPFWEALAFGLNYAAGFVLVHLLHFTIATKQPAMTASRIAAAIGEGREREPPRVLEDLVTLTAQVSRTQLVAIAGNVLLAFPVSLAIAGLWLWAGGTPLGGPAKAAHMLADLHPWLSAALPHAAIAGVCLFLAGIVSGYYDNRCVYARVPQRLARHPGLNRLLGPARSAALARYVEDNLGAIAGNVAFGLMLGFVGFGGTILGLPLDIRHVTFAAANLAYGSVGLDWQIAPLEFAIAALGVGLIGLVNLVVSFALAFATAMKARGLRVRQFGAYARVLAARMRREPRSFVLPPPEAPR